MDDIKVSVRANAALNRSKATESGIVQEVKRLVGLNDKLHANELRLIQENAGLREVLERIQKIIDEGDDIGAQDWSGAISVIQDLVEAVLAKPTPAEVKP